jgi:hypothetical protein
MNPLTELFSSLSHTDHKSRSEYLQALLRDSGLGAADIETVLSAVNDAMRQYLAQPGKGGELRCSFCHRSQSEVKTLVVATQAAICDRCSDAVRDTLSPSPARQSFLSIFTGK